ncbi:Aste57867_8253 [Aphanomyces stellatus]|uniref:Aste57867_8253 protein n=1 Tax=Aphanomyces stellatus TaxID=120398 RepID=A0A485KJR6_9STRA|nr:hypothetical protein As57867_008222 [Aphanomyces stellatus]VFT85140.1 Aste57867_8253 [Aphanomyces stellatus]
MLHRTATILAATFTVLVVVVTSSSVDHSVVHSRRHTKDGPHETSRSQRFANPTSACQKCGTNLTDPSCLTAFHGLPGAFCHTFVGMNTVQNVCCCASSMDCPVKTNVKVGDGCACKPMADSRQSKFVGAGGPPFDAWALIMVAVFIFPCVLCLCCQWHRGGSPDDVPVDPVIVVEEKY